MAPRGPPSPLRCDARARSKEQADFNGNPARARRVSFMYVPNEPHGASDAVGLELRRRGVAHKRSDARLGNRDTSRDARTSITLPGLLKNCTARKELSNSALNPTTLRAAGYCHVERADRTRQRVAGLMGSKCVKGATALSPSKSYSGVENETWNSIESPCQQARSVSNGLSLWNARQL
jgi:hypothetical protein